jgi:hypothetical protein
MQNKKPVIAVMLTRKEKQDFTTPEGMVARHSNPNLWKGFISHREDYIYAPSYPKIEEAYEKAGKKIFRPDNEPKDSGAPEHFVEENPTPVIPDTPPPTPSNNTEESNNITDNEYNEDTNVQKDDIVSEDDFIVEDVTDKKPKSEVEDDSYIISQYSDAASIPWPKLRSVAAKISSVPVKSKEQAIEIVQAEYYD